MYVEFHNAIGQFINYRIILSELHPGRILYLAVPAEIYHTFVSYLNIVVSEKIACKYDLNDYINGLKDGQIGTLIVAVEPQI